MVRHPAPCRIAHRAACVGVLLAAAAGAFATPAAAQVPAPTPAPAAPTPAPVPDRSEPANEPAVQRRVIEDEQVRIEELRVRGLNRRLVVQPKIAGVGAYEILPEEPGRDAADRRAAGGQRVWRLLSF